MRKLKEQQEKEQENFLKQSEKITGSGEIVEVGIYSYSAKVAKMPDTRTGLFSLFLLLAKSLYWNNYVRHHF